MESLHYVHGEDCLLPQCLSLLRGVDGWQRNTERRGGEVLCLSSIISWGGGVSKTTIEPSLRSRRMSYSVHVQTSAFKKRWWGYPTRWLYLHFILCTLVVNFLRIASENGFILFSCFLDSDRPCWQRSWGYTGLVTRTHRQVLRWDRMCLLWKICFTTAKSTRYETGVSYQ